ncbi:MAG: response regulator [Leptolyngbyaceae cyanobacterium bins.349]|nr:response regulator [Leptolyngbyaceae cyanobacterium bins.349]
MPRLNRQNTVNRSGEVLIVDDHVDSLHILSCLLTAEGYHVRVAKSGPMALIGAKTFLPDVILLDIRMPKMDGYEICQHLKADARTCNISIIFLSALDEPTDKAKAFDLGGADYITKPFKTDEVLARVKHQVLIQQLKKQMNEQQSNLSRVTSTHQQDGDDAMAVWDEMLTLIAIVLDYCDRYGPESGYGPQRLKALRQVYEKSLDLLQLINNEIAE